MNEFLDNQAITADMLNNIAIDLGDSDFSAFNDGEPYFVDKLNEITADLVTSGILNLYNKCNVTVSNGVATVDTGVIVFDSGAKMRITSSKTINVSNDTNYIYALNDEANNTVKLVCSDTEPSSGDFVKVAKVIDGSATMYNSYAVSKVPFNVNSAVYKPDVTLGGMINGSNAQENTYYLLDSVALTSEFFSFILINYDFNGQYTNGDQEEDNVFVDFTETNEWIYDGGWYYVKIVKNGKKIELYGNRQNYSYLNAEITIKFAK